MVIVGTTVALAPLLSDYPLLAGQAWRYLLAGLVLVGVMLARHQAMPRWRLRSLGRLLALACTGLVGFNWLLIEGAQRSDPAFLAAVVGATPLVLAVVGPIVGGGRIRPAVVAGSSVVVAGIVIVQGATTAPLAAVPYALGLLACEVAFTLLAVPLLRELSPLQLSTAVCVVAVPLLAALAAASPGADLAVPSLTEAAALLHMAVLTTAVAFLFWYGGVVRLGADRAGLFAGVMPVAGLLAGLVGGTSSWSLAALVGVLLCGSGIALGLSRPRRPGSR